MRPDTRHLTISLAVEAFPRLVGGLAVAIGVLTVASAPCHADDDDTLRILPLGDSITMSTPGYKAALYQKLVEAGYEVDFVGNSTSGDGSFDGDHEGHGGFTIGPGPSQADRWTGGKGNLYDNLDTWLAPDNPKTRDVDIILLLIGINDHANIGQLDPEYDVATQAPARMAGLLEKILRLRPNAVVLLSSVLPGGNPEIPAVFDIGPWGKANAALPELAEQRSHVFFYDGRLLQGTDLKWQPGDWDAGDVIHPNASGYAKLAEFWFASITDAVEMGLPDEPYQPATETPGTTPSPATTPEEPWVRGARVTMTFEGNSGVVNDNGQCFYARRAAVTEGDLSYSATIFNANAERAGLLFDCRGATDSYGVVIVRGGNAIELHRFRGNVDFFNINGNRTVLREARFETGASRRYEIRVNVDRASSQADIFIDDTLVFDDVDLPEVRGGSIGFASSWNGKGASISEVEVGITLSSSRSQNSPAAAAKENQ